MLLAFERFSFSGGLVYLVMIFQGSRLNIESHLFVLHICSANPPSLHFLSVKLWSNAYMVSTARAFSTTRALLWLGACEASGQILHQIVHVHE